MHVFLLGVYLEEELLGHGICTYSSLIDTSIELKIAVPAYIPNNNYVRDLTSFPILVTLVLCFTQSLGVELLQSGFNCHISNN